MRQSLLWLSAVCALASACAAHKPPVMEAVVHPAPAPAPVPPPHHVRHPAALPLPPMPPPSPPVMVAAPGAQPTCRPNSLVSLSGDRKVQLFKQFDANQGMGDNVTVPQSAIAAAALAATPCGPRGPVVTPDLAEPSGSVRAACDQVMSALLCGKRAVGLRANSRGDAAILTRAIVVIAETRKFHVLRITAPPAKMLTLDGVAFQVGIDLPPGAQAVPAMRRGLAAQQVQSAGSMLLVEGAEALDASALALFEAVCDPASWEPPLLQLVLVGRGGFGSVLADGSFPTLKAMAKDAIVISGLTEPAAWPPRPAGPIVAPERLALSAAEPEVATKRPRGRLAGVVTAGVPALLLLAGALWIAGVFDAPPVRDRPVNYEPPVPPTPRFVPPERSNPDPPEALQPPPELLPPRAPPQPPPELLPPRPPPALLPGPAAPVPPSQTLSPEAIERLRARFDAFLDHAGRDVASLTPRQRQALFDEYLTSHAAPAPPP